MLYVNTDLIPNNVFDSLDVHEELYKKYTLTDSKIQLLYDVLIYCQDITKNDIFNITINYIRSNPSFDQFSKQTFINALYNALESLDITTEDSMFMAYYRAMRYLLPYIN